MAGPNRTPAQGNGHVPHRGTTEGDPHSLPQGQPSQPQHIPSHEQLSRWSPPQQAYAQHQQYAQQPVHPAAPLSHGQQFHAQQAPNPQGQAGLRGAPQGYPPAGYGYPAGQQPSEAAPVLNHTGQANAQTAQTPAGFGGYQPQTDPYAQQARQNARQGTAHPGFPQDDARGGYPTAYDRYAPPAQSQPASQDFQAPHVDPHALNYPAAPARSFDQQLPQSAPQQAYGQHFAPQPAYAQPNAADMQNWDLATYAPGQSTQPGQTHHYAAVEHTPHARADDYGSASGNSFSGTHPSLGHAGAQHEAGVQPGHDPRYAQQAWPGQPQHVHAQHAQPQPVYAPPQHAQAQFGAPLGEPSFELDRYGQHVANGQGYPAQQTAQQGYDQHGYPAGDQQPPDEYLDDVEPEPEPRRGPRALVVVGALVGAIVMGGGMVKGYQYIGGGKDNGKPPIVKADKSPTKTRPTDAGGKDIANNDKVFLNRLAEGGATASTATSPVGTPNGTSATPNDPEAPRRVQTVVVNKDGTITPQMQQAAPAPVQIANAAPASALPGMVVDGFPRAATPTPPVNRQAPPAAGAKVADLPLPKVKSDATRAAADTAPVSPPPPKKKVAVRDDLKATPAESSASGANGYVAALTSKKSRDDALKTFANLHQTYPELQGKVPDVREVNLGAEKGTWYRLIVGPPSSRESAGDLCKKLKDQGLKDCWVTAY